MAVGMLSIMVRAVPILVNSDPIDEIGEPDTAVIGGIVASLYPHFTSAEILQLVLAVLPKSPFTGSD